MPDSSVGRLGALLLALTTEPVFAETGLYCVGKNGEFERSFSATTEPPAINGRSATLESQGVYHIWRITYQNRFGGLQVETVEVDRQRLSFEMRTHNDESDVRLHFKGHCKLLDFKV